MRNAQTIPSQLTETERAYFAGLFDGEGYVSIRTQQGSAEQAIERATKSGFGACRFGLVIGVSMTDYPTIHRLHEKLGGSAVIDSKTADHPRWNKAWHWRALGDTATAVLKQLYPYLGLKKKKAALAFKFQEVKKQARYRKDAHRIQLLEELYLEMKDLNVRGRRSGGVETERLTPTPNGMKFQSDLGSDVENAATVMALANNTV